jgi:hypothetical protein
MDYPLLGASPSRTTRLFRLLARGVAILAGICIIAGGPVLVVALDAHNTPASRVAAGMVAVTWGLFSAWMSYEVYLWIKDRTNEIRWDFLKHTGHSFRWPQSPPSGIASS